MGTILAGVVSGVIATLFISFVMFGIKPKLAISSEICRDITDKRYRIKVVNLTHAALVDVKYFLYAGFRSQDGVTDIREVPTVKPKLEFMLPYKRRGNTDYAMRISYDLTPYITHEYNYFVFTISARHPFSGSTVIKRQVFQTNAIQCGKFQIGKSMTILHENHHCHQQTPFVDCPNKDTCGRS